MKSKMPDRYYQKAREQKRDESIAFATKHRFACRHMVDPEGSAAWVETGIWPPAKPVEGNK